MIYTWESVWELCIRVFLERAEVGFFVWFLVLGFFSLFALFFAPSVLCFPALPGTALTPVSELCLY